MRGNEATGTAAQRASCFFYPFQNPWPAGPPEQAGPGEGGFGPKINAKGFVPGHVGTEKAGNGLFNRSSRQM